MDKRQGLTILTLLGAILGCVEKSCGFSPIKVLQALQMELDQLQNMNEIPGIRLYTPSGYIDDCNRYALSCYILEMNVIEQEAKLNEAEETYDYAKHVKINAENTITQLQSNEGGNCLRCEEYNEKNYTDFLKGFKILVQKLTSSKTKANPRFKP